MDDTNPNRTNQMIAGAVALVLIIGGGIYFLATRNKGETPNATPSATPGSYSAGDDASGNKLTAGDQLPGSIVYITSLTLAKGAWVVIHADENGKPGKVIGAKYFNSGIQPGSVNLSTPTVDGQSYYITLHSDDGDKIFDAAKDLHIKDAQGNDIAVKFKATQEFDVVKG